jgi:hypothetical protein
MSFPSDLTTYLRSPQTMQARSQELFNLGLDHRLEYFTIDLEQLDRVVDYVDQLTCQTYPDRNIPFHSRWRHLPALQISPKRKLDLVIPSILLDAGAGADWRYVDGMGQAWQRSEGLAIASLEMFNQGLFAQEKIAQTDGIGLTQITLAQLATAFQVTPKNPIDGLEGRLQLLHNLGQIIQAAPSLADWLLAQLPTQTVTVADLLTIVLMQLAPLWPQGLQIDGKNLGDVGYHPQLAPLTANQDTRYIPFHKLSQWLTCSLIEPLQELGWTVTGLEAIVGLAEYRNGGLFLDFAVLKLRDPQLQMVSHPADSVLIVEWRGLTLHLLGLLRERLQSRWQQPELSMLEVLQGGSWTAGRAIAAQLRSGGTPPLRINSDGTTF